jgi:acetaldehyde dehydrogenase
MTHPTAPAARPAEARAGCAIVGSGNIGTDLLVKILRKSQILAPVMMIGIDPASDGLARARSLGVETTSDGIAGFFARPELVARTSIVFDATSARTHAEQAPALLARGLRTVDLTPAAVGPAVVPPVNLGEHLDAPNVNLITCGGQATIPIVHAVSRVAPVLYAEIVSSIASRSAGPGTRQNIDEFTRTTARGLETIGGARRGKAIIILNPAEPPLVMRNTVYCVAEHPDPEAVSASVARMADDVRTYVPGYTVKAEPLFEPLDPVAAQALGAAGEATKITVLLEVEGAAHYLPSYAGNLDIMTAAALRVGESLAERVLAQGVAAQ